MAHARPSVAPSVMSVSVAGSTARPACAASAYVAAACRSSSTPSSGAYCGSKSQHQVLQCAMFCSVPGDPCTTRPSDLMGRLRLHAETV